MAAPRHALTLIPPHLLLDPQISCDITGDKNPAVAGAGLSSGQFTSYALAVQDLALACYYTENVAYLTRAVALTQAFFINPATLMNPHLSFGQNWPGVCCSRHMYKWLLAVRSADLLCRGWRGC